MLDDRWDFEGGGKEGKEHWDCIYSVAFDWVSGVWESGDKRGQYTGLKVTIRCVASRSE